MKNKNILSYSIIIAGILVALFSILLDFVGLGKEGVQSAQLLGVQAGIVISLFGILVNILQRKSEISFKSFWLLIREKLAQSSGLPWVILGTLPSFMAFFIFPLFFGPKHRFEYLTDYLISLSPIGFDLHTTLEAVQTWLQNHQTTQFVFAPLINFLFAPLLLLGYPGSFYFVSIVTLVSYLILGILAILMSDRKNHSLVVFIAAVSIFSYGLQFELERGQSHTIALMLSVLAIYIFHKHPDYRFFAYLFFCISVQLKFYPALFVVMFVDDWRDWKNILKRFFALGLINFLLLFLYGVAYFSAFYQHMVGSVQSTLEMIPENHSIKSFVFFLFNPRSHLFGENTLQWVESHAGFIENTLYVYFLICFVVVLTIVYLKNIRGVSADLLMVCVIGALSLPSISHDYMLPMLMAPFAMTLADWYKPGDVRGRPLTILVTIIISLAYSVTLFPLAYKPMFLRNSLPMIFVILTGVTLMCIVRRNYPSSEMAKREFDEE